MSIGRRYLTIAKTRASDWPGGIGNQPHEVEVNIATIAQIKTTQKQQGHIGDQSRYSATCRKLFLCFKLDAYQPMAITFIEKCNI